MSGGIQRKHAILSANEIALYKTLNRDSQTDYSSVIIKLCQSPIKKKIRSSPRTECNNALTKKILKNF